MRLSRFKAILRQVCALPPKKWFAFINSWRVRKKTGCIPCVFPGSSGFVLVSAKDYYGSHQYFVENASGREELLGFVSKLREKDVLWDLGAFRGAYTLAAIARMKNSISVTAVEALEDNARKLSDSLRLNDFDQVHLIQCILGNGDEIVAGIEEDMLRVGSGSTQNAARHKSVTVDQLVSECGIPPTIIKLDVEGFELNVLEGAKQTLVEHHPRIWFEVHPQFLKERNSSIDEVRKLLAEYGYTTDTFDKFRHNENAISFQVWLK